MPADVDQESAASASDAPSPQSRWLIPIGVTVLFLIAMLAAAVSGQPSFSPPDAVPEPLPAPTEQQTLPPVGSGVPQERDDDGLLMILSILMMLLVASAVITALVLVIRAVLRYWRSRPLRRQEVNATDAEVSADVVPDAPPDAPTIRRGLAAARTTIGAHPDPTDAIIAAWIGLEETAVDSGVGRGLSETPAEFALRILLHRPGLDEAAHRLLRLYEGVRFGGRIADETERADAARSLARIEEGWR